MGKQRARGQKAGVDFAIAMNRAYDETVMEMEHKISDLMIEQMCLDAQDAFCKREGVLMFAPANGVCPYCGMQIFGGEGYGILQAARRLITRCPYCSATFCD